MHQFCTINNITSQSSLLTQGYTDIKSQYPVSVTRWRGCCGRDCMVVGFTTTYAISDYHH